MKKMVSLLAFALLLTAATVYAFVNPTEGVYGSKHDMNMVAGLTQDSQGRVCAFCHTPHHAVDLAGQYNPLWSHTPTNIIATAYASATFDAGSNQIVDPLKGPSRLCMSCHDGVIAPDQHYGGLFPGIDTSAAGYGTSLFGGDEFGQIAVGKGGNFGNDHPIGFDVRPLLTGYVAGAGDPSATPDGGIRDLLSRHFFVGAAQTDFVDGTDGTGREIAAGLYSEPGDNGKYMTCATCHDVHNKDNVKNDATTRVTGVDQDAHLVGNQNYFVYAPENGSQLCLSCHAK